MGFLINFFLINSIHNKRFVGITILGIVPVFFTLLFIVLHPGLSGGNVSYAGLYPKISLLLYLHFLLPLIALFLGSAVIGDEKDDQTLSYFLTRPIARCKVVLMKIFAAWVMLSTVIIISLFLTYSILTLSEGFTEWSSSLMLFFKSAVILIFGAAVYLPFFTLIGGLIKRPVVAGLFFVFGWEASVAFIPGKLRYFTIVHYLHRVYPSLNQSSSTVSLKTNILNFIMPVKNISPLTAIIVLFAIIILCTFISSHLLSIKEYKLDQV
ncbi:ABC transporter permease [bacterium]|nr:ABC transporter permease [bacterium]